MARLTLLGSNHRLTSPSRLQACVACRDEVATRLLQAKAAGEIAGGMLLATCNRLEVLVELADRRASGAALSDAQLQQRLFPPLPDVTFHRLEDANALRHLVAVASGLESMVVGEEQILGQIRQAMQAARARGLDSCGLRRVVDRALAAARRIRKETGIGGPKVSVSSLAARQLVGAGPRMAVIGAGEMGRLALEALARLGVRDLLLVNRSVERAESIARHFGARAMSLARFDASPPALDGILTAIAGDFRLEPRHVRGAGAGIVVDLSMPSVVDPRVAGETGAQVIDLERLGLVARSDNATIEGRVALAREMVQAHAERLAGELRTDHRDLGAIVEHHVRGALEELHEALQGSLSHLGDDDREQLHELVVRLAKRHAHLHLRDVKSRTTANVDPAASAAAPSAAAPSAARARVDVHASRTAATG